MGLPLALECGPVPVTYYHCNCMFDLSRKFEKLNPIKPQRPVIKMFIKKHILIILI